MALEVVVPGEAAGERLDRFLTRQLAGRSRRDIQKLIKRGVITLNQQSVPAHYLVKPGDRVSVGDDVVELTPAAPDRVPTPDILFENDSVLVINKPAGLIVHPGAGVRGPTLIDWLRERVPAITTVGDEPNVRPGIVHRLDRDVSGVMVIAKTQESFANLKRQFKNRTVKKEYLALVHGVPKNKHGTIEFGIERSPRQHGRMVARPIHGEGRQARTHYLVERTIKDKALLRINLQTGRTHQIRVHLKALGHPIVGDSVYTTKPFRRKSLTLQRPFLHSARLTFADVGGTRREFTAPLPEELRRYLESV